MNHIRINVDFVAKRVRVGSKGDRHLTSKVYSEPGSMYDLIAWALVTNPQDSTVKRVNSTFLLFFETEFLYVAPTILEVTL